MSPDGSLAGYVSFTTLSHNTHQAAYNRLTLMLQYAATRPIPSLHRATTFADEFIVVFFLCFCVSSSSPASADYRFSPTTNLSTNKGVGRTRQPNYPRVPRSMLQPTALASIVEPRTKRSKSTSETARGTSSMKVPAPTCQYLHVVHP